MTALVDAVGTVHQTVTAPVRIVSLVPSLTELLIELGLTPSVVGRTGFCIHPASMVAHIPKVGGTKDVNIEKIRALRPTHLIVNIDENEKPTVEALAEIVPHIVVTHPQTPEDNLELYRLFGGIFNAKPRAEELATRFRERLAALAHTSWPAARVLYLIWKDPWMTVAPDTYIGNMLALVGWHQVAVPGAARYPQLELQDAVTNVDEILLSSEPYRFTAEHVSALRKAYPRQRVRLIDGEMLSWYGPRAIAGLDYLAHFAVEGRGAL